MFSFLKKDTVESVREKLYKMHLKGIELLPEEYYALAVHHVKDGRDQQLKFLDLAAQKGHIRALMTLAEQNPVKHTYWKQAADNGSYIAACQLVDYYWQSADYTNYWKYFNKRYNTIFFSPNYQKLVEAYRKGFGVEPCEELVRFFEMLQSEDIYTIEQKEELYQVALHSSDYTAKYLAIYHFYHNSPADFIREMEILAQQGYQKAQEDLANYFYVPQQGENEFTNAEKGLEYANNIIKAEMYLHGLGIPQSDKEACDILLKAIEDEMLVELIDENGNVLLVDESNIKETEHYKYANIVANLLDKLGYDAIHGKFYRFFAEDDCVTYVI
jgi:hypothetical protein